jgi:hypothetical protein
MELLKLFAQIGFVSFVGGTFLTLIYFTEKSLESALNEEIQELEERYNLNKFKE